MEVATYLLFVLGLMGAADIAMYHSVAHGIRHHPDSRAELIIHSLRGPTYAVLFVMVPNFALHGLYFWALIAMFAVDVAISIADFAIERRSREFFGGLPSGEYVLHMIMAMVFGALVVSVFYGAGEWRALPANIAYDPAAVPGVVRLVMVAMAVMVFVSGVQDAVAAMRLRGEVTRVAG